MIKATVQVSSHISVTGELRGRNHMSGNAWVFSMGRVFRGLLLNSWEVEK